MSDAREWWFSGWDHKGFPLNEGTTITVFVSGSNPGKAEAFKVIEFSAFEAMRRERDFWIEKYNIIMKEHLDLQFTLGKENEKLRAALDEIDNDKHISSTVGDLRRIAREALK